MKRTAEDIMKMIQEQDIKMVDFKIVDINGQFRHVTIPASQFTPDTMKEGIGFDASNYVIVPGTGEPTVIPILRWSYTQGVP